MRRGLLADDPAALSHLSRAGRSTSSTATTRPDEPALVSPHRAASPERCARRRVRRLLALAALSRSPASVADRRDAAADPEACWTRRAPDRPSQRPLVARSRDRLGRGAARQRRRARSRSRRPARSLLGSVAMEGAHFDLQPGSTGMHVSSTRRACGSRVATKERARDRPRLRSARARGDDCRHPGRGCGYRYCGVPRPRRPPPRSSRHPGEPTPILSRQVVGPTWRGEKASPGARLARSRGRSRRHAAPVGDQVTLPTPRPLACGSPRCSPTSAGAPRDRRSTRRLQPSVGHRDVTALELSSPRAAPRPWPPPAPHARAGPTSDRDAATRGALSRVDPAGAAPADADRDARAGRRALALAAAMSGVVWGRPRG